MVVDKISLLTGEYNGGLCHSLTALGECISSYPAAGPVTVGPPRISSYVRPNPILIARAPLWAEERIRVSGS